MNARINRIAACTAAALGVAFTGTALAEGMAKSTTTKQTTTSTTTDTRLNSLNGATIKDANGNAVGTIKSYTSADGQVTATIMNPAGVSSSLPLGSTETIITEMPASGSVAIVVGADGTVQHPFGSVTTTETNTTTMKTPAGKSKSTTSTTTQYK